MKVSFFDFCSCEKRYQALRLHNFNICVPEQSSLETRLASLKADSCTAATVMPYQIMFHGSGQVFFLFKKYYVIQYSIAFIACSTNFVLQVMNAQRPGNEVKYSPRGKNGGWRAGLCGWVVSNTFMRSLWSFLFLFFLPAYWVMFLTYKQSMKH